ncbi:MAG: LapA family protein [Armatimonadetes bacterium]|nr:LapA family protein [Armatimonadota bacterium]
MSVFTVFALLLFAAVTVFALANPSAVVLRLAVWEVRTTLALATIGAAVLGGFLVFVSGFIGQQRLRSRLREMQARLRELESQPPASGGRLNQNP